MAVFLYMATSTLSSKTAPWVKGTQTSPATNVAPWVSGTPTAFQQGAQTSMYRGPGGISLTTNPTTNTTTPQVTTTSGGNTGGGSTSLSGSPSTGFVRDDSASVFDQLKAAMEAGNQAEYDRISGEYNNYRDTLNQQLTTTAADEQNAYGKLDTQQQGVETDVTKQKQVAEENVATEISKAAGQARDTQRTNRNVLRALGILGSTYAAEALQKPMNAFDQNKAELTKWGMDRLKELDTYLTQKKDEFTNTKNEIMTKYADLKAKIQGDIRYSENQKMVALQAARAGAQQNLAQLQQSKATYDQQIESNRQALTTQIAQLLMNKTPSANLDQIAKQTIAFQSQLLGTNPNSQQVQTYTGKRLSGYDASGNPIYS